MGVAARRDERRRRRAPLTALALLVFASSAAGSPPVLYHSPLDDGANGGVPATIPAATPATLHLYLDGGSNPSTADACLAGDGDELCGYLLRLTGSGMNLELFTPADPDILFNLSGNQLDLTGGDFEFGELGPTKLGDLAIADAVPGGSLDLQIGDVVSAALAKETLETPTAIVEVPEPGGTLPLLVGWALLARSRRAAATGGGSPDGEPL